MRKQTLIFLTFLSILAFPIFAEPLDKVVAVVNDDVITNRELEAQIEVLRKQIIAKNMQLPPEDVLRKQVLQHLIDEDLQLQLAKNNNITIDSTELDETIAKIATDNHLSLTQMREELSRQGLSWDAYRENIRKELLIGRIQQRSVSKDVVVSTQQVEDYLKTFSNSKKTEQLYHLQNIVIPLPEKPTPQQLTKASQKAQLLLSKIKQGSQFTELANLESSSEYALESGDLGELHLAELPEIFANQVLSMKVNDVVGPLRTGNGLQFIKLVSVSENKEQHKVTKTHVRHILLKQDASITAFEANKQINNLYQQLKSGKDFAAMAKRYSLDAASAVKGGDLGWVVSDELAPAFATAMNNLPIHTVSKPIKTPFGWHLIEVLERKTVDDSETFQRQQARSLLQQRKFQEAVQNWQQHIRNDAYVNIMEKALA